MSRGRAYNDRRRSPSRSSSDDSSVPQDRREGLKLKKKKTTTEAKKRQEKNQSAVLRPPIHLDESILTKWTPSSRIYRVMSVSTMPVTPGTSSPVTIVYNTSLMMTSRDIMAEQDEVVTCFRERKPHQTPIHLSFWELKVKNMKQLAFYMRQAANLQLVSNKHESRETIFACVNLPNQEDGEDDD